MGILRKRQVTPPGGWRYVQFETKLVMVSMTAQELIGLVTSHRKYKGLDRATTDEAWQDIEEQVCLAQDDNICRAGQDEDWEPSLNMARNKRVSQLIGFSRGLVGFVRKGGLFVDPKVAEARQNVCLGCPLNQPAAGCSCAALFKMIDGVIPQEKRVEGLNICAACGCSLQVKTRMPESVVRLSNKGMSIKWPDLPIPCWQKEIMAPKKKAPKVPEVPIVIEEPVKDA